MFPTPRARRSAAPRSLLVGACLSGVVAPELAHASGLDSPGVGTLQSGPLTADPAAIWHNPGQLGFLRSPTLQVGAGLVVGDLTITRERRGVYQSEDTLDFKSPAAASNLDPSKTGKAGAASATILSPAGDLFFTSGLGNSGLTLGVGAYAPYAATVNLPDGGAQRFSVQDAFIAAAHMTGAVGLKVNKHLGLGVGVTYVLGLASIAKVQDFGALQNFGDALARKPVAQANDFGPNAPTDVRELSVLARPVKVTDGVSHGVTFGAGVSVRPTDDLALALTYQHGAHMSFDGRFSLDLNDDFFTGDLAHVGMKFQPMVKGKANVQFNLPQRIGFAGGYEVSPTIHVELRTQYVRWSTLDAFKIRLTSPDLAQPALGLPDTSMVSLPRRWNNTFSAAVMGRFGLNPEGDHPVHLIGLVGYDPPASPDETVDASSPDGQRLTVGAGADVGLTQSMSLVGDLRLITVLPRTVTTSDNDLGNGRYSLFLAMAGAHLQVRF